MDDFVFGEQPAAAKWNQLIRNDEGFNDGSAIATNAITSAKLAVAAINLGSATITSAITTTSTTAVQAVGLTKAVTIPAGGRDIWVVFQCPNFYNNAAGVTATITVWNGTVASGTQLIGQYNAPQITGTTGNGVTHIARQVAPAAGAATFNIGYHSASAATTTLNAGAGGAAASITVLYV